MQLQFFTLYLRWNVIWTSQCLRQIAPNAVTLLILPSATEAPNWNVVNNYYTNVSSHDRYLSTFLESLQTWNCPQFDQECKRRTFNYTDFTSLMYLRFCNRSQMEERCYDDIQTMMTKQNTTSRATTSTFDEFVSKLDLISLNNQDLMNPCVQVAMYDIDLGGHWSFLQNY